MELLWALRMMWLEIWWQFVWLWFMIWKLFKIFVLKKEHQKKSPTNTNDHDNLLIINICASSGAARTIEFYNQKYI